MILIRTATFMVLVAVTVMLVAFMAVCTAFAGPARTTCRDAKTGQYVSHAYAKKYPGLTTCEASRYPLPKKE